MADEVATLPRSARNIVINNTILGGEVSLFGWTNLAGSSLDRVLFANNTLVNATMVTGQLNNASAIQNNIFWRNDGGQLARIPNRTGLVLSNNLWSSAPPLSATGADDVVGSPLLALSGSTAGGQLTRDYFSLPANSPAKGAGCPISMGTDYYWVTSLGLALDIGAYVGGQLPAKYQ
jgi:hypothetical protein